MQSLRHFSFLGIVLLLSLVAASAQERRARPTVSDFNIEIINLDGRLPIFSIPGAPARAGYIAHSQLNRVADWKASAEVPAAAAALRLQFWLEEGVPRIEVTAYLGKIEPNSSPHEWGNLASAKVVSRLLQPEETVTISETERYGIAPFQVRAFRAQPWSVGPPEVNNKTQALTVSTVTEERPTYTVNVRNVSHQHIKSIRWYGVENGRRSGGSGHSGARAIPAGGTFQVRQRFGFPEEKAQQEGAEVQSVLKREIVIAAIVFDDGTFEGEADTAAEMAAHMAGHRVQLVRVEKLLKRLATTPASEHDQAFKKLKTDVAALSEEYDPAVVDELKARFASASADTRNRRIREEVVNGLRFVKNNLVGEIERFEFRRKNSPGDADFYRWLKELIDNFGPTSI